MPEDIANLVTAAATDDTAKRMLRRVGSLRPEAIVLPSEQWPIWLQRDTALRQLSRHDYVSCPVLKDLVTKNGDIQILRAVLRAAPEDTDGELVGLLFDRLHRQAEDSMPVESDSVLQHRLVTAVFDSPYLSPTNLRPLAIKLKDRIEAGSRGPILRFLAEHGATRPP